MQPAEVEQWFLEYLQDFAACGRGEADPTVLLGRYAVPLLVTLGDRAMTLLTEDEVVGLARTQADGMLAAGYHESRVLSLDVTVLNAVTARVEGAFVRVRADGSEIGRLEASYLLVGAGAARRVAALVVRG